MSGEPQTAPEEWPVLLRALLAERAARDRHIPDGTRTLAQAAADIEQVLPEGWSVSADDELVSCYCRDDELTAFIHVRIDWSWWCGPDTHLVASYAHGTAHSPVDAARAALAALGIPTPEGETT